MQCNDDIRDIMEPNPTQQQVICFFKYFFHWIVIYVIDYTNNALFQNDRYTAKFEECAVKCVDKHIDSLPRLLQAMKSVLAKGAPSSLPS